MKEFIEKLVSRLEEEIDIIKDEVYREYEERIIEECAIENVIDIVNELAEKYINTSTDTSTDTSTNSVDTSSGWISVKDRLPTEEGSYLVVGKTGGATVTRWYMPNKFHQQGHFGGNSAEYIRYWMPRPQAPKYEPKENKTMTNADRIRSMTDEELAELFYSTDHNVDEWNCIVKLGNVRLQDNKADILAWLQSEVEGVTENE